MESLCKKISEEVIKDEEEIIQKLNYCLDNGGDIDHIFFQWSSINGKVQCCGTVLHYSTERKYERVVRFALNRGASIGIKSFSKSVYLKYQNALEMAAFNYNYCNRWDPSQKGSIFEILKERSLKLYSSYGLTPLHIDCLLDTKSWSQESEQYLEKTANASSIISTESPLWPGMTPILLAAKLWNTDKIERLLDLGADPFVRDSEGNSTLHYLYYKHVNFFDERLYAPDGRCTFSSIRGESHFHMACRHVKYHGHRALLLVQEYLDQGISPDLPIQRCNYKADDDDAGKVGLHIAAEMVCPELMRLLLQYGADVNKEDFKGRIPVECIGARRSPIDTTCVISFLCLLIEAGLNQDKIDREKLLSMLSTEIYSTIGQVQQKYLDCIKKLTELDENFVSKKLMDIYHVISNKSANDDWDEADYASRCQLELKTISNIGLRRILDDTIIVGRDFKDKFNDKFKDKLRLVDFNDYPIYGSLLKLRLIRKVFEFEEKRKKVPKVIPQIQKLFQSFCHFPDLCAELILWNFKGKELDQFFI